MDKYNNNCNKHFINYINQKYKISYYSDEDNKKFIILKLNDKILWAKYKIICSFDINTGYLKKAKDMIIIEKMILDDKLNISQKSNLKELDDYIVNNILNHYIGYVVENVNNMKYYIRIEKIIRF